MAKKTRHLIPYRRFPIPIPQKNCTIKVRVLPYSKAKKYIEDYKGDVGKIIGDNSQPSKAYMVIDVYEDET